MKRLMTIVALLSVGCSKPVQFGDGDSRRTLQIPPPPPAPPFEVTFTDGAVTSVNLDLHPETHEIRQSFQLRKAPPRTRVFTQKARARGHVRFQQGWLGETLSEPLRVGEGRKLDLMFVIGNSPGDATYQARLKNGLAPLVSSFAHTDWQIGFVTTDSSCLLDVITRADWENPDSQADAQQRFDNAVEIGEHGQPIARGIEMAIDGLHSVCPGGPPGQWVRRGSLATVIFVTDRENCSSADGDTCQKHGLPYVGPDEFISQTTPGTRVYALLRSADCGPAAAGGEPLDYVHLTEKTGGSWRSICQADYTQALKDWSSDLSGIVHREFILQHVPDPGSVTFQLNGQPFQTDFTIEGQKLILTGTNLPTSDDDPLAVSYNYGGQPRHGEVKLDPPAASDSLQVRVNGALLAAEDFVYDQSDFTVHFKVMPPDRADVQIDYRTDTPLRRDFAVGELLVPAATSVYVDDAPVPAADVTIARDTVSFAEPPADGAKISVVYNTPDDYATHYPSPVADPATVDAFQLIDAETGEPLAGRLVGNEIVCTPAVAETQRLVTAIFETRLASIILPPGQVGSPIHVTPVSEREACQATYDPATQRVAYDCPDHAHPAELAVSYSYVTGFTRQLKATGAPTAPAAWRVWIDGVETRKFTRDGVTVRLTDERLAPGSQVKIQVTLM